MKDRKLLNSELGRISAEAYKEKPESGIAVVLDNIRSAHNIGSAFRSADSFGADFIAVCGISATPPSAEIHKSALGAEDSVPWKYFKETSDALEYLRGKGFGIISVEQTESAVSIENYKRNGKTAYVFGNEVDGVQQSVVDSSDGALAIPQFGTKHSLNVSVCIGVVLYKARFN